MRGRKPKPTWQKKLEGNRGKRALNSEEPVYQTPTDEFDLVPPELEGFTAAAAEWSRIVPMLRKARAITSADRSALIGLCVEWDRYLHAIDQVKKRGMVVVMPNGVPMQNPYLTISNRALAGCQKLWSELGLTPSSRSRLKAEPTALVDEFSEFEQDRPGVH